MAYIDNSDTKKEINDAIRGNAVSNIAPTQLANQVIPVLDVNPKNFRIINVIKGNSAAGTLYTTPTDQDFFLCALTLSASNKTASQDTIASITCFPKGETTARTLIQVNFSTSALIDVNHDSLSLTFEQPILLERGSIISLTATNAQTYRGVAFGYVVDP
jgi:hypothetical protein